MTVTSVGSTDSTGGTHVGHGSSAADGATPGGFEALLAGAHPAPEAHAESSRGARHERDNDPCDQTDPNAAAAGAADDGETKATDSTDDASDGDAPAKPDGADDKTGMIAALALTTPITPTTTVPPTDATATATGDGTAPVADATVPVIDPAADDTAPPPPAPQVVDLAEVLANLSAEDPNSTPAPAKLPLPDLPVAAPTQAHTDSPAATAANAARESFTAPPASTERARPPVSAPPTTGAATFAPAPPPAPPVAAAASIAAEDGAAARVTPPPSEQLVSVLTPLRTNQNGSYTLRLELKPPELGRVEMRVEMRDGVLHASIHAEHHNSAQTLRDALSDLRERLGAEGVRTGALSVSDGGVGARQDASSGTAQSRGSGPDLRATDEPELADGPPAPISASDPDTTSLLDVRV